MRRQFLRISTLFFILSMSISTVWAEDATPDPTTWFYVQLNAGISNPGCGTNDPGLLKVSFVRDANGREFNDAWDLWITNTPKPQNPYYALGDDAPYNSKENWDRGFPDGLAIVKRGESVLTYPDSYYKNYDEKQGLDYGREYDAEACEAAFNWYHDGHWLNETYTIEIENGWPSTIVDPATLPQFATSSSVFGYSQMYAPGIDMGPLGGLMSTYVYFNAIVKENPGWYFSGWSYTEGGTDIAGTATTDPENEKNNILPVLPSSKTGYANKRTQNIYATFNPVLVSDYKVDGMIAGTNATTTVTFDIIGERVDASDFDLAITDEDSSPAKFEQMGSIDFSIAGKAIVTVKYIGVAVGEHRGSVTLASKSGCSSLTAPVFARVSDAADMQAKLYNEKVADDKLVKYGDLTELIAEASATQIVVLNKNYETALDVNKKVTLDLNGYNLSNTLTVESGGELTLSYSKYGGKITNSITVKAGGKLILNGTEITGSILNKGTLNQNGAAITGAVTNEGTLIAAMGFMGAGLTSTAGTLTINNGTFKGETAITISGGTATINKATISGTTTGILVSGGTTTITSKLVSVYGATNAVKQTAGKITLENGKFDGATPLSGTIDLQSGYFKTKTPGITIPAGKKAWNVLAGNEFAEGYLYFVSDDATMAGVCRIGSTSYATLEEALTFANNNPTKEVVIIMTNDYILPAGYYTLPAKATLIVPMSDEQEKENAIIPRVSNNAAHRVAYVQPTEFRRLTFAKGVNINVQGLIEISCTQRASDDAYAAMPHGPYGHLVMEEGSRMTLQNGAELRAWGYMTGKGETDARRGAVVREQFQMGDWKGGTNSFQMINPDMEGGNPNLTTFHIFPITQYFIQNIESPVKYHPGAVLSTTTSVSAQFAPTVGVTAAANDIAIIGVSGVHTAMFLMDIAADAENTWVRKWYDTEHDVQTYEVNSGAHIGSMLLELGRLGSMNITMNSGQFVLPIMNNMKIHLLSGSMDFTQTTALLPGAEVEVDKESTVSISVDQNKPEVVAGSLYVIDAAQWSANSVWGKYNDNVIPSGPSVVVKYSPSFGGQPDIRSTSSLPSASINVHGTFDAKDGFVFTTENGANIHSTNEDAGTFVFSQPAPDGEMMYLFNPLAESAIQNLIEAIPVTSAQLKNEDGSYQATAGTFANHAFIYMDDTWSSEEIFYFDCYAATLDMTIYAEEARKKAMKDLYGLDTEYDLSKAITHLYIKPQEWLEVIGDVDFTFDWSKPTPDPDKDPYHPYLVGVEGNADHTFSDAAGAGRLFILQKDEYGQCQQWWEVEQKDNFYHCLHPQNDTYYYWDEDEENWKEKHYTITWKNWDGTIVKTANQDGVLQNSYEVPYGTMAEFLGTENPTREPNIDYTYDFTGWSPALGRVTSDVTYKATYESKPRKYTIIFQNEGGVEIERLFLTHNEVPVCENTPTKVGHTLVWTPAIAAVTGDATYRATWREEPPTEYEITFFDYDGTTVLKKGNVNVGDMPTEPAIVDGKPQKEDESFGGKPASASGEFTYVFDHWSPDPEKVSATSAKSYIAVYREVAKRYTVIFQDEDGTEIERHDYAYGETPVCTNIPSKENTPEYSYGFAWTPQIEAITGAVNPATPIIYTASFPATKNKYTVRLQSNNSAVCTFTGAGIYEYGTELTIGINLLSEDYVFLGWRELNNDTRTSFDMTVTQDITLTAEVTLDGVANDLFFNASFADPLPDNMTINARDLIMQSDGENSAQLIGYNGENLKVWGNAIFWLNVPMKARTWYAVAVPWMVDVAKGIYSSDEDGMPTVHQTVASSFDIIAFNSVANAAGKEPKDCWTYVDEMDGVLHPGTAYLIYLTADQPEGLLFYKKDRAPLLTTKTSVSITGGNGARDNWNAIANPALYYAELETGATIGQKYDGETDTYIGGPIDEYSWIVADPIFVQVTAPKTIVAQETQELGGGLMPLTARHAAKVENDITDMHLTIELMQASQLADRIFIATASEKEDKYVIGKDVAKMGVSNKVAQMWINRYKEKLCMNTIEQVTGDAEYPLGIYAPKSGEYTITNQVSAIINGYSLYLTKNGEAIANLSDGAYTLDLQKGTTNIYGLRISAHVPQVATDLDAAIVDADGKTTKVLYHGQVFIIRGEKVYTLDGQLVK